MPPHATTTACTEPSCYQTKVKAHVAKQITAKPQFVQISTAYGKPQEGSKVLPRNQYPAIRDDKPKSKDEVKRSEFKVCKFTTDAIITEGSDVGTAHKVCANPACPVHHPKPQTNRDDAKWKAEQEKQSREAAIANTTGIRVLSAIVAAVPVRLMKRDLLFVAERLASLLEENRLSVRVSARSDANRMTSSFSFSVTQTFWVVSIAGLIGSLRFDLLARRFV